MREVHYPLSLTACAAVPSLSVCSVLRSLLKLHAASISEETALVGWDGVDGSTCVFLTAPLVEDVGVKPSRFEAGCASR